MKRTASDIDNGTFGIPFGCGPQNQEGNYTRNAADEFLTKPAETISPTKEQLKLLAKHVLKCSTLVAMGSQQKPFYASNALSFSSFSFRFSFCHHPIRDFRINFGGLHRIAAQ